MYDLYQCDAGTNVYHLRALVLQQLHPTSVGVIKILSSVSEAVDHAQYSQGLFVNAGTTTAPVLQDSSFMCDRDDLGTGGCIGGRLSAHAFNCCCGDGGTL